MGFFSDVGDFFKRAVDQFERAVSSKTLSGVFKDPVSGLRRTFSRFGEEITNEVRRATRKIEKEAARVRTRRKQFLRRVIDDPVFGTIVRTVVPISALPLRQDQARRGGLSGFQATKKVGIEFGLETATSLATLGLAGGLNTVAQVIGTGVGGVAAGAGSGALASGVARQTGGRSVSFLSGLGDVFGGFARDIGGSILKEAANVGTGLLKRELSRKFVQGSTGGAGRRGSGPGLTAGSILDRFVPGVPSGAELARRFGAGLATSGAGGAIARRGGNVPGGPRMITTVPYNPRNLPTQAFRDLPGGIKAGFVKGKGTTFKLFVLEDGSTVLREHKPRRMNPLNMKALNRGLRRAEAFTRVVKRARKAIAKVKKL